jgi:uncharacterized membrane protein required for colicin V production
MTSVSAFSAFIPATVVIALVAAALFVAYVFVWRALRNGHVEVRTGVYDRATKPRRFWFVVMFSGMFCLYILAFAVSFTTGGMLDRIEATLPPVRRPKIVPRS